jgi:hypothetical protein
MHSQTSAKFHAPVQQKTYTVTNAFCCSLSSDLVNSWEIDNASIASLWLLFPKTRNSWRQCAGDVAAFGSPTAYHCVGFTRKSDYDEAVRLLDKAKVRVFSTVHSLAAAPMERRGRSRRLCSHRLPSEHVAEGALDFRNDHFL